MLNELVKAALESPAINGYFNAIPGAKQLAHKAIDAVAGDSNQENSNPGAGGLGGLFGGNNSKKEPEKADKHTRTPSLSLAQTAQDNQEDLLKLLSGLQPKAQQEEPNNKKPATEAKKQSGNPFSKLFGKKEAAGAGAGAAATAAGLAAAGAKAPKHHSPQKTMPVATAASEGTIPHKYQEIASLPGVASVTEAKPGEIGHIHVMHDADGCYWSKKKFTQKEVEQMVKAGDKKEFFFEVPQEDNHSDEPLFRRLNIEALIAEYSLSQGKAMKVESTGGIPILGWFKKNTEKSIQYPDQLLMRTMTRNPPEMFHRMFASSLEAMKQIPGLPEGMLEWYAQLGENPLCRYDFAKAEETEIVPGGGPNREGPINKMKTFWRKHTNKDCKRISKDPNATELDKQNNGKKPTKIAAIYQGQESIVSPDGIKVEEDSPILVDDTVQGNKRPTYQLQFVPAPINSVKDILKSSRPSTGQKSIYGKDGSIDLAAVFSTPSAQKIVDFTDELIKDGGAMAYMKAHGHKPDAKFFENLDRAREAGKLPDTADIDNHNHGEATNVLPFEKPTGGASPYRGQAGRLAQPYLPMGNDDGIAA